MDVVNGAIILFNGLLISISMINTTDTDKKILGETQQSAQKKLKKQLFCKITNSPLKRNSDVIIVTFKQENDRYYYVKVSTLEMFKYIKKRIKDNTIYVDIYDCPSHSFLLLVKLLENLITDSCMLINKCLDPDFIYFFGLINEEANFNKNKNTLIKLILTQIEEGRCFYLQKIRICIRGWTTNLIINFFNKMKYFANIKIIFNQFDIFIVEEHSSRKKRLELSLYKPEFIIKICEKETIEQKSLNIEFKKVWNNVLSKILICYYSNPLTISIIYENSQGKYCNDIKKNLINYMNFTYIKGIELNAKDKDLNKNWGLEYSPQDEILLDCQTKSKI